MNQKFFSAGKLSLAMIVLGTGLFFSTGAFAQADSARQQKQATIREGDKKMNDDNKNMTFDEYKQDLKGKYKKVMDNVSSMEKEAKEKTIDAPEFKEALNNFQSRAKEFGERMKNSDAVPADKREEFKNEMKEQLEKLNNAYDNLKERFANLNK